MTTLVIQIAATRLGALSFTSPGHWANTERSNKGRIDFTLPHVPHSGKIYWCRLAAIKP